MSTPQSRSQQLPPDATPQTGDSPGGAQGGRTWGLDDRGIEPDPAAAEGESAAKRTWGLDDRGIEPDLDDGHR